MVGSYDFFKKFFQKLFGQLLLLKSSFSVISINLRDFSTKPIKMDFLLIAKLFIDYRERIAFTIMKEWNEKEYTLEPQKVAAGASGEIQLSSV